MNVFSQATYHMCVFNMVCAGACGCVHITFPSKPDLIYAYLLNYSVYGR